MKWFLKWFWSGAKKPTQAIQEEIAAENGRIEELTEQLADVEQKLRQAREKVVQKTIAERQRRRQDAEQSFVMEQEAVAAARTRVSDKNVSAIEVCAGEVRWHNGLLEQLWHIYYIGPTGSVEKAEEEWQLVPELEEPAIPWLATGARRGRRRCGGVRSLMSSPSNKTFPIDLSALADKQAADISYGDQRRLDLALAMTDNPRVLLLDEPTAGLSFEESKRTARHLRDLANRQGVNGHADQDGRELLAVRHYIVRLRQASDAIQRARLAQRQ